LEIILKKPIIAYFEKITTTTTNDSVDFDDIHWSPDMEEAWNIIKEHSFYSYHRCFPVGIVFFRREQPKEHFIIRV
jgi:hypothetical protein